MPQENDNEGTISHHANDENEEENDRHDICLRSFIVGNVVVRYCGEVFVCVIGDVDLKKTHS